MRFSRIIGLGVWCVAAAAVTAAPINPEAFHREFQDKKKDAEVVVKVRVLAVVCKDVMKEGEKVRSVSLDVTVQVLEVEKGKGTVNVNSVLVVPHTIALPSGPGPGSYGYWASLRRFPTTAGVLGEAALNWDKEKRCYVVVAGWVPEPNQDPTALPTEPGKAVTIGGAK
jgi:hypothetical protein